MTAQPQLLRIALDKKDVVYTPDWVARDMVEFFKPTGRILEPAAGDGAILKYLPGADWCEIEQGRDFYEWVTAVDWIVTNPPYSQFGKFLDHSFLIAPDILFLIPTNKPFNGYEIMTRIRDWGGDKAHAPLWAWLALGLPYWLRHKRSPLPTRLHRPDVYQLL